MQNLTARHELLALSREIHKAADEIRFTNNDNDCDRKCKKRVKGTLHEVIQMIYARVEELTKEQK